MPEKLKCPSCGGTDIRPIVVNGQKHLQCFSTVTRERQRQLVQEPCKFWTTKETAWLPNKSS